MVHRQSYSTITHLYFFVAAATTSLDTKDATDVEKPTTFPTPSPHTFPRSATEFSVPGILLFKFFSLRFEPRHDIESSINASCRLSTAALCRSSEEQDNGTTLLREMITWDTHSHTLNRPVRQLRKVHSRLGERMTQGKRQEPENEEQDSCQRLVSHRRGGGLMIQLKTPEHATVSIKDNDFLLVVIVTNCWHRGRRLQSFCLSHFASLCVTALLPAAPKCNLCTSNRKPNK